MLATCQQGKARTRRSCTTTGRLLPAAARRHQATAGPGRKVGPGYTRLLVQAATAARHACFSRCAACFGDLQCCHCVAATTCRAVSTPPRPPRPSSAPPKQRFDPTEYVRQQRERQQQLRAARQLGSSPARSTRSSRGDASGASTPRSAAAGGGPRCSGSPAGHDACRRSGSAGRQHHPSQHQRPGSSCSSMAGSARGRLGVVHGVAAMTAGACSSSSSRAGSCVQRHGSGAAGQLAQPSGGQVARMCMTTQGSGAQTTPRQVFAPPTLSHLACCHSCVWRDRPRQRSRCVTGPRTAGCA